MERGDLVESKQIDRTEQKRLGGEGGVKQWSGGDYKLAEEGRLERRLSSLSICLREKAFTVQQGGVSSFQRLNKTL